MQGYMDGKLRVSEEGRYKVHGKKAQRGKWGEEKRVLTSGIRCVSRRGSSKYMVQKSIAGRRVGRKGSRGS